MRLAALLVLTTALISSCGSTGGTDGSSGAQEGGGGPATAVATPVVSTTLAPPSPPRTTEPPYDTERYFEVAYGGRSFLCEEADFSFQRYQCVTYFGGSAPAFFGPELYCSGSQAFPDCSELWYPSELEQYELAEIDGRSVICEDAGYSSFGDSDCYFYDGGDPSSAIGYQPDYFCSESVGTGAECDQDEYPSNLEGLSIVTIDGSDYVCQESFNGQECYAWYGMGSPADAIGFTPDYYCNRYGCSREGYP